MNDLARIQAQLDMAKKRVIAIEQMLADHPEYPSIVANLESARRIKEKLEAQCAEVSERESRLSRNAFTTTVPPPPD